MTLSSFRPIFIRNCTGVSSIFPRVVQPGSDAIAWSKQYAACSTKLCDHVLAIVLTHPPTQRHFAGVATEGCLENGDIMMSRVAGV